jgi:thiamine biosynthesis lipoprotein
MIKSIRFRFGYFSLFLLTSVSAQAQLMRFSFTESKMGSPFSITLYCEDSAKAKMLSVKCFALVDSLVTIYSDYLPDSELNRLCHSAGSNTSFKCSPALFDILKLSKEAFEKSKGTFDITLGPLTHFWRKQRKEKTFPDSTLVKEKLQLTGFNKFKIDTVNQSVSLAQKGMQLDLGGIAQGYIAQKTIDILKRNKIENALVDVSGDIVCIGKPPGKTGWAIAVSVPKNEHELLSRQLILSNCAITTSGDTYQFIEHNGKRYSHLLNPSTGYGITSQKQVTIIATNGAVADWLTKACSILPVKDAKKLAQRMNAGLLIVGSKKNKIFSYSSKKFNHFWKTSK